MNPETADNAAVRQVPHPAVALLEMAQQVAPVGVEAIPLSRAGGRVLAQSLTADRDSPACAVSAMDGYALRLGDSAALRLPILGEVRIGRAPPLLPPGGVLRITTGAPVPPGAEAVVRREDVEESAEHISIKPGVSVRAGQDIRCQGENLRAGQIVAAAGAILSPALLGAAAGFGLSTPKVFRRVRVGVLVTGDEVLPLDSQPEPWQLRDSNGCALEAMLTSVPWIDLTFHRHVPDDLDATRGALGDALAACDAVVMTGGVSMGNRDFAQIAVGEVGAHVLFHRLPIRPGAPMLGAIGPQGQAILGLPGNPVSVMVTARRMASIVLRRMAGCAVLDPPPALVQVDQPDMTNPKLWLYRPVTFSAAGAVAVLPTKGSGDMVSAGRSDGFVEIAPAMPGQVLRPFYRWEL
jgi:molybdopterin molybdotransferase